MATVNVPRIPPLVEQLLEDQTAQENLRRGAGKLHDAYRRSQKRRVKVTRDEKLKRQLKSAVESIADGAGALLNGAQKPQKRRGRMLRRLLALGAIGAGVAVALNKDLRSSVFGDDSASPQGDWNQA
jgi:hypothetical protein